MGDEMQAGSGSEVTTLWRQDSSIPGVGVRLHDTCAVLYDGRLGVEEG
jgi:hypothetical protein